MVSSIPTRTPILLELESVRAGLKMTLLYRIMPLEINVDSLELVQMLHTDHPFYANIIFECRFLMQTLGNPVVAHTYREQNYVANILSKEETKGRHEGQPIYLEIPPSFVQQVFLGGLPRTQI